MGRREHKCYRIVDCENLETIGMLNTSEKTVKSAISNNLIAYTTAERVIELFLVGILMGLSSLISRSQMKPTITEQQALIDSLQLQVDMLTIENDELTNFCTNNKMNTAIGKFVRLKGNNDEPTTDSIMSILTEVGAWYPEYIMAQAVLESATFTSEIYRTNNNLFGMKQVSRRSTTQTGKKTDKVSYGHYNNWQMSVLDRVLWDLHRFETKPTRVEYEKALMQYAEDSNYISKLNKIINDYGKN